MLAFGEKEREKEKKKRYVFSSSMYYSHACRATLLSQKNPINVELMGVTLKRKVHDA